MRKIFSLKLMLAVLCMGLGINATWAAEQEVSVKMTYINGTADAADTAYGLVETAYAGYNKISGGAVALANSGWGVNNIAYLQVDASAVPGPIKKVTLSGSFQQISKRGLWYGFGYNSSEWSETLTWNTADRSITTIEGAGVSCGKSDADLEGSVDITAAFTDDEDKIVTILVYQTAAGGGYIKDAKAVVEYEKADEVLVSYSFDDAENPALTAGSNASLDYTYDSPFGDGKFLNVWGANNTNGETPIEITSADMTTNGQWTLEFDWAGYSGCNSKPGATKICDADGNAFFTITDAANWGATMDLSTGGTIACYPCNKATRISANTGSVLTLEYWHHFTVIGTANGVSVTIEKYAKDAEGVITKEVVVKNAKASATNVTPAKITLKPGSCGSVAIDNLKLTVGDLKIVSYDYTVKFITEDGTEFKEAETRNAIEGEALAATDEDKATITEGKTQYVYLSDDAEERTVEEEGLVLTITYQKLTVADYVVNYVDAEGNVLKAATTHANAKVGTEVNASAAEAGQFVAEGKLYQYVSGAEAITVAEDETANVITLVFAEVEGVEAYYYQDYEAATAADWKTGTSGRYDPIQVNGNTIAAREVAKSHTEEQAKVDEEGIPVVDEEGNPVYETVTIDDGTETIEFGNKSNFLSVNQAGRNNNGATLTTSSDLAIENDDFVFEARVLLGSSNDQAGTRFEVYNKANDAVILKLAQTAKSSTTWKVNDGELVVDLPNSGTYTGDTNDNLNNYKWYNLKVLVYKGYTFLTVTDEDGNAIVEKEQINTIANTYGLGKMQFATSRYYANFAIDDVLVRNVLESDIPEGLQTVNVALNFVDEEGNQVKEPETIELSVGDAVTIRDIYKESFKVGHYEYSTSETEVTDPETGEVTTEEKKDSTWVNDKKYIYVSDNSADVVAAEGASVNIVFRGVTSYTLRQRFALMLPGASAATNQTVNYALFENVFEGDVITYFYPKYQMITNENLGLENALYTVGDDATYEFKATYTAPAATVTPAGTNAAKNFYVTLVPSSFENVVYYMEAEDIEGLTPSTGANADIRFSNGKGAYASEPTKITTLEPGVYSINSDTRGGNRNFIFTVNGAEVLNIAGAGYNVQGTGEFTIATPTDVYFKGGDANGLIDYVKITKVGDIQITDVALDVAPTFAEDGTVAVAGTFNSAVESEEQTTTTFSYALYQGEELVKEGEAEAADGAFSFALADLPRETEYTLVINKAVVATADGPIYTLAATLASVTFMTEENPVIAATNLDFSASTPIAVGVCTYEKDAKDGNTAQMQEVENWTMGVENGDARAGAVYAYGSSSFLGGADYLAPATNPEGVAEGNALGLVGVWSATVQYIQRVTLRPGNYKLIIPVYNSVGGNSVPVKSLIGFIADNGTEYLADAKAYPVGEWTNEEIVFTLTEKTDGIYTLGYQGQNVGSASAQHLFIDQIKVETLTDEQMDSIAQEKAAAELAAAKTAALAEIDALPKGYGLFCYDEWGVYDAQEAIEAAEDIAAVDAAVAAYKATQIVPEAETQYVFKLKDGGKYLGADAKLYEEAQKLSFVAVEGGYAITNGTEYVSCTGANAWSMAASAEPYAWVVAPAADGFYRITKVGNAAQGIGVDNTEAGSATYADKAESDKALWTIEEYAFIDINDIAMTVAEEPEDGDYGLQTKVSFKYAPKVEGAYANGNVYLSPYFVVGLYQGEEKVKEFEFTSYEDRIDGTVADSLVSGYISGFDFGTEYTVKLDSVAFTKFDMTTFESIAVWSKALTDVSQTISYAKPKITIDTDVTAQFGLEPATWTGASGWCAEQFGPYVETNDGRRTLLAENYQGNVNATGDLMYQTLSGLANGTYRIEIYAAAAYTSGRGFDSEVQEGDTDAAEVYAEAGGERKSKPLTAFIATSFSEVNTVALNDVEVTDGTVKIGLTKLNPKTNWHIIQIKGVTATVDAEEALAAAVARAEAINAEDVSEAIYANLQSTVEANNKAYASAEGYIQAIANIDAAVEKANIYKIATPVLAAMKAEIDKTNVYTAEAYDEYYGKWFAKYEAGELTQAEAQALQDPSKGTGWHAAITVDNFLLSAWDTNPDFVDAPYYINTWSTEGDNDGSEFRVPFFEYWTGDDSSLGEKTLTATMEGVEPGKYEVSAWVRVRVKNGVEVSEENPVTGITLSANGGDATDVTTGARVGESQFYLGEFTAVGEVGTDSILKIQFNVAADNNISWLSFKNVNFEKIPAIALNTPTFNAENGTQAEPNMLPAGSTLKVTYTAENLEANGLTADDVQVKIMVMMSGDLPENSMAMGSETAHRIMPPATFYIPLGETDFPEALRDGYVYQSINILSATLVKPATEDAEEVEVAVYAGEPVRLLWVGLEAPIPAIALNAPTFNAENGTQAEPNMLPNGETLKINYTAENLEANGLTADDVQVKVTVMVAGDVDTSMSMGSETAHTVRGETFYIPLGETDFPVALKEGYYYQTVAVMAAELVKPATEETEEVSLATYAGAPAMLRWVGIESGIADGISTVDTEAVKADGKYVVDGKIVIVKNGKTYSATGVLIK